MSNKKAVIPEYLTIEPNASCQLRCPTCPTTSEGYPAAVGSGYLQFENFKKLIDNNSQIKAINLESRGEMFLNKDLLKILEYAHEHDVVLYCDGGVNFNFIGERVLEGLVKYKFRNLRCSIDGASQETYKQYRVGGNFDKVIQHIKTLNEYKKKYKSIYPKLLWQFVVFGHNEHELPKARAMAKSLGMSFFPKMNWDSSHSPIRAPEFVMKETGWPAATREEYYKISGQDYVRGVCYTLWKSPRINWNGKVLGCCWNSWGDFGGNVFQDGYIAAVNNDKINYARDMLLGRAEPVAGQPCSTCDLYLKLKESGEFLTEEEIYRQPSIFYRGLRYIYHLYHRVPLSRVLPIPATFLGHNAFLCRLFGFFR